MLLPLPTASPQSLLLGPRGSGQHPPSRKQDAIVGRTALSPHRLARHSLPGLSQPSEPSATRAQPWRAGVPCQPLPRGHRATLLFAGTVASAIKVFGCWTRLSFRGGTGSGHGSAPAVRCSQLPLRAKVRRQEVCSRGGEGGGPGGDPPDAGLLADPGPCCSAFVLNPYSIFRHRFLKLFMNL